MSVSARLDALAGAPETFPGALLLTGSSEAALERESLRLAARLLCPDDDPHAPRSKISSSVDRTSGGAASRKGAKNSEENCSSPG